MKWLLVVVVCAMVSIAVLPMVAHADIEDPAILLIEDVRAWRHMLEANDTLMVVRYNISWGNETGDQPYQPIYDTFDFTFTDAANSTTSDTTAYPYFNMGYAKGVVGFYWEADDEDLPAWGDLGNVTITGTALFDTPPDTTYTLTSSNWATGTAPSTQREDLRQWLLNCLLFIELDWNNWYTDRGITDTIVSLTATYGSDYIVASTQGEAYLTLSIDNIERMVPLLFPLQTDYPYHDEQDFTLEQQIAIEDLHADDVVGETGEGLSELMGGVGRIWATTLLIMVGAIVIIFICQSAWQKANCGMLTAYALILLATPEGLFQMGLMALFALLAVLQLADTFFWRRSAG